MKLGATLYVTTRKAWRSWLAKNYKQKTEIWLVFYRKDSGKPRISYNDAVEEALCYGWIDSIVKKIDDERFAQRFSVRKPGSTLSQMNKERVRKLIKQKKMTKAGLAAIARVYDPSDDKKGGAEKFTIAPDILRPLKADRQAWKNFQTLPAAYRRIRIAFIESRRRHGVEQFRRSLKNFIKLTARNKRFGFVKEMINRD